MITRAIQNCVTASRLKGWHKTYWAFDIHGTILYPIFQAGVISTEFYPYAREVMQLLSKREDIVRILYTCSYPQEIVEYLEYFKKHDVHFDYVNENPDVCGGAYGHYDRKFYFNVLVEDKAGFDSFTNWKLMHDLLSASFSNI